MSTEERGSVADDESTLVQGGWGVADELIDDLAHMNDLDLTWGFDLDAFLRERAQQAPDVGEAGGRTLETIGSSQGGAVDVSSAPAGRAETETIGLSYGGAVDAPSVPAGRADSDPGAASIPTPTKGTVRTPARSCRGGLRTSIATGDSSPRQYGAGPGVRVSAWGVNLVSIR